MKIVVKLILGFSNFPSLKHQTVAASMADISIIFLHAIHQPEVGEHNNIEKEVKRVVWLLITLFKITQGGQISALYIKTKKPTNFKKIRLTFSF